MSALASPILNLKYPPEGFSYSYGAIYSGAAREFYQAGMYMMIDATDVRWEPEVPNFIRTVIEANPDRPELIEVAADLLSSELLDFELPIYDWVFDRLESYIEIHPQHHSARKSAERLRKTRDFWASQTP